MNEEMKASRELDVMIAERVMNFPLPAGGANVSYPYYYSTELSAAWMIVEKLRTDGWRWVISSREAHTESWWVAVERPAHWEANHTSKNQAIDSSLPRAICLVALKAVENHDE